MCGSSPPPVATWADWSPVKRFREDLSIGLNVVPIRIPPLRHRMEDLPLLARHFLDLHARGEQRAPLTVAPAVWRRLSKQDWPGNVRELENFCRRAIALADSDRLDEDLLALIDDWDHSSDAAPPLSLPSQAGDYRAARQLIDRQLIERGWPRIREMYREARNALGISRTTLYAKLRRLNLLQPRGTFPRL